MSSKLTLYDLYEIKKEKDSKINNAFNIILETCHNKIKSVAKIGGQSLYYTIPPIIIGLPLYKYDTCMNYIITSLKKSGLYVSNLESRISLAFISKFSGLSKTSSSKTSGLTSKPNLFLRSLEKKLFATHSMSV